MNCSEQTGKCRRATGDFIRKRSNSAVDNKVEN
jgi:hypothetical protein